MTLESWIPVGLFLIVAMMIPAGLITLGFAFGTRSRRPDAVAGNKQLAFESGVSTGHAGRQRNPIDFYLTAMLFIIFDIEMVFMVPLGLVLGDLGTYGFVELLVFVGILAVGYAYVWGRGALEWE
ncbi:MAG: NADH:ubiquinone oxidoreductase subunit 3 [Thermoleophilia bacterium]|nr:NADH:ubiquinone oxidoreductase subunit 3 [Thermoleophilia bacterium]